MHRRPSSCATPAGTVMTRGLRAEAQSGDEEGRVEVQPSGKVIRDVLHVVFGAQRVEQLSRIGKNVSAE